MDGDWCGTIVAARMGERPFWIGRRPEYHPTLQPSKQQQAVKAVRSESMSQIERTIQVSEDIHLHTIISTPNQPTSPARPALVLFHFWGGANNTYRPLITHLCSDFALIVPSLRGWGESSRPTNPGAYRTADYGADIVALLQKLNSDSPELFSNGVVLVGHSMGAKIAQLLLTQQHLLPPSVMTRGMVLLAPAPAGSHSLPPEMRKQQVHAYDNAASAEFVVRNVLLGRLDAVSDRVVGEIVADAVTGSEGARAAWPGYGMGEDFEDAVRGYGNSSAFATCHQRPDQCLRSSSESHNVNSTDKLSGLLSIVSWGKCDASYQAWRTSNRLSGTLEPRPEVSRDLFSGARHLAPNYATRANGLISHLNERTYALET
ncbi:hypothetical protein LTR35_018106 [Friedmanniomyces endolithicus]|nr:hypothetical protein LTR35_018106 [Friedmanniomyces endolithicus]KAK0262741.1 hypothetical protein LTS00_018099 [Friedmanniomyces endolithicus]